VGHDEEPFPEMGSANFCRAEYSRFNAVTHSPKAFAYIGEHSVEEIGDIFKEANRRRHLSDNSGKLGPEIAIVLSSSLFSGNGMGGTREPSNDAIHFAAPRMAVEGEDAVPNRRAIQGLVFHPRHENRRGVSFKFDITNSSGSGFGKLDSEFEPPDSGTEGQDIEGTNSHISAFLS
jgi:hypothetical protein